MPSKRHTRAPRPESRGGLSQSRGIPQPSRAEFYSGSSALEIDHWSDQPTRGPDPLLPSSRLEAIHLAPTHQPSVAHCGPFQEGQPSLTPSRGHTNAIRAIRIRFSTMRYVYNLLLAASLLCIPMFTWACVDTCRRVCARVSSALLRAGVTLTRVYGSALAVPCRLRECRSARAASRYMSILLNTAIGARYFGTSTMADIRRGCMNTQRQESLSSDTRHT